jgi:hypothetical protein
MYKKNIPIQPLNTPILFIVFNRPLLTEQVFKAIRKAQPPRLYIAADGPRPHYKGDSERCSEVRNIVSNVDWPCTVKFLFRKKNAGCQFGPRTAIDWFFKNEKQGIILEDDCLPSQSFFRFCEENLNRYSDTPTIMAVTGTNITKNISFEYDYFFSRYALMWGWATWDRAWKKYDPLISNWESLKARDWLSSLNIGGLIFKKTWTSIFDDTHRLRESATWWDYQWIYCCWLNNGLTVAPSKNLVKNLGFDEEATHTRDKDEYRSQLRLEELSWPLKIPMNFDIKKEADKFIGKYWFSESWICLLKHELLKIPLVVKLNNIRHRTTRSKR